jgi:DDE superfamily endonuclease
VRGLPSRCGTSAPARPRVTSGGVLVPRPRTWITRAPSTGSWTTATSHAGRASIERLEATWRNLRLIELPIHASWLNQIELSFSIVQRKALSPNGFDSLDELADRLLRVGEHYRQIARPFDWTFARADLERVLAKITEREPRLALAA